MTDHKSLRPRTIDFETLKARIGGRRVVLDENMLMSNLRGFLTNNNIQWRSFRQGVTDDDIMRHLYPDEVVITADRAFAYRLQERSILVPLTKSHLAQMEHLMNTVGKSRRGTSLWSDIATCPICSNGSVNADELTFWDTAHMLRHVRKPHIEVKHRR